ncbi:Zinc finger, DNA-directed DNA polymerase, family B, alpha [Dillenia turbinata]|uniref:DNA polymerase n=1 Tax=Dillenia turbinata TaxID=194707 RepID=A0AAN8V345_9MAGN
MADDEQPIVASRRRSRGVASTSRAEALERLKALRSGNRRSEPQIKIEDSIYDIVDEDDYNVLVAKRREEYGNFIVDDNDTLGYGDEGQEEDWTQGGLPPSSDESDGELEKPRKKKPVEKKKDPPPKKPSVLSQAAALMGKQRISNLFTSSVFKKNREGLSDSIVDDVIAEFAPDEADRERRRRVQGNLVGNSIVKREGNPNPSLAADFYVRHEEHRVIQRESVDSVDVKEQQSMELEVERNSDSGAVNEQTVESKEAEAEAEAEAEVAAKTEEVKERKEESRVLNAKIMEEKQDPALSATAGWQAVMNGGNGSVDSGVTKQNASSYGEEKVDFVLDSDGSLPFYIIDAHEEFYGNNMGTLYLFGKVKAGSTFYSCCVVVKNMQRCVYAIPNSSIFHNDLITKLEKDVEESQITPTAFRTKLQDVASGLKNEIAKKLVDLNVSTFSMTPVKRSYAFERSDIPTGENYVLKINYPFKDPALPSDLQGETFGTLLGTNCGALELFLVKRKIKGPSWLSISKFTSSSTSQRISWCKFEVIVDSPKDIRDSSSSKSAAEVPPVVVTAINLKTVINEKQNVNEIVAASLICCHKTKIDIPMPASEWKRVGVLTHFSVVRKLEGGIFPMGFAKEAADRIAKAGSNVVSFESSERALLNRLMIELHKLDSDILVGHNVSGFDLDVLLHRAQVCRVPSSMWSKIGRLKRSVMPKLTKASTIFGSGASPGIMSCIAGRLLCDTYLCSRDLLKEVSYSLTQLAKTQLNKDRQEITPHDIPAMFQTSESLMKLVDQVCDQLEIEFVWINERLKTTQLRQLFELARIEYGETDAWLSLELMFHLSVLPLTRQLTNISGNLWGRTLQGARAQRVEFLLLHAFHAKKYIVPDKLSSSAKETKLPKRKGNYGADGTNADDLETEDECLETESMHNKHGKGKRGPEYSGGLVLEPKKGLYDKYILLLDFNSLYPSIIQEYNICFTTVVRPPDGMAPSLPSSNKTGILPELLKNLVHRRQMVKSWLKTASGLKAQQFDIQQQALKLAASTETHSKHYVWMLGFFQFKILCKATCGTYYTTSKRIGREILQSTVDLVQNNLNLEVIYGDTDSIMIYSGLDDAAKAKLIAGKVIQEVNKKYKCLEIDLDGLYKRMLLLKKKKYAAVKVQFKDGVSYEVIERKGLDMVRRDWSLLSKELGDFCLSQILSGGSCEDVVESIHSSLMKVQEDMRNGEVVLEKYVITKTLSKPPEAYPDGKNQPHVQVALRLKQSGYTTGCSAGDTVPYVICCEQGASAGSSTGFAQRARHPDELKRDHGKWMIDIDYYLSQQIHPVVSRLCASIQGTSPSRLADCLGLDSSKFQKSSEAVGNDPSSGLLSAVDDEERFRGCEPLVLSCRSCSGTFECPSVFSSIHPSTNEKPTALQTEDSTCNFWQRFRCPKCPDEGDGCKLSPASIANQVKRQVDGFISLYYKGSMMCDDESCNYTTRSMNLRVIGDSERGTVCPNYPRCSGHLVRKYTEADLYKQLTYFCHLLDTVHCIEKMEISTRIQLETKLARIRPAVDLAASIVRKLRDRCSYGWVKLGDLVV